MLSSLQRLMAIIQLCIVFSLALNYLVQPFMGEYFSLRSRMLIYEYVFGVTKSTNIISEDRAGRNADRFQLLPRKDQVELKQSYQQLEHYASRSAIQKIGDGLRILLRDVPIFEQAWIFFSIVITVLILIKKEGAKQAAWILPFIVLAYSIDNQISGKNFIPWPDTILIPSENEIIQNYLKEPFAFSVMDQKKQLESGWKHYLIDKWASSNSSNEVQQLEEAEFQFTLARLKLLSPQPYSEWLYQFHQKINPLLLTFFFAWNLLFALIMNRSKKFLSIP